MKNNLSLIVSKLVPAVVLAATLPLPAFAQGSSCTGAGGLVGLLCTANALLNPIIRLLIALGLVYFVWGVVRYFIAGGEEAKTKGRNQIIYGIIGLVIIFSIWGVVSLVMNTFGIGGYNPQDVSNLVTTAPANNSCVSITSGSNLGGVIDYFTCIIGKSVIPLIFAVAIVSFIWGTVNFFIIGAEEEAKRKQGKQFMIWGLVALAVMISIWGLVSIFGNTFGINTGVLPSFQPSHP